MRNREITGGKPSARARHNPARYRDKRRAKRRQRRRAKSMGYRHHLNLAFWLRRLCGPVAVVVLCLTAAAARPTFRTAPDYLIDTWETEDGLPENSATAMGQTPDGFLWFGTFSGLVRFDGIEFTTFDPANTPQLPSGGVVNLHVDRRGWLWVSTYRGLVVRAGPQWRAFGTSEGWAGDFARTFAERPNGDLLITPFHGDLLEVAGGPA